MPKKPKTTNTPSSGHRATLSPEAIAERESYDRAVYEKVFDNNRAWVAQMEDEDEDFFEKLASDQNPTFLYIGCSDSRVPANVIMGVAPGEVFVARNVANLVPNTDLSVQSVIEYAVTHLEVKHIVVCGHYGCGGVKAAMQSADMGVLNPWLREVSDIYRMYQDSLDVLDEEARYRHLVELNVREQCVNVIKSGAVQKMWLTSHFPTVHGWVYDLRNGLLKDLNLDFDDIFDRIRRVYNFDAPPK